MFFVDMVSAAYAQVFSVLVLLNSTSNHIFLNELHKLQHHPVLVYARHVSCTMVSIFLLIKKPLANDNILPVMVFYFDCLIRCVFHGFALRKMSTSEHV